MLFLEKAYVNDLVFQNDIQQFSGNLSEMKENKKQKIRDEQIRF